MPVRSGLRWHGARVVATVERAVALGLEETAHAALAYAIPRAPIRTGFLRGSGFVETVRRDGFGQLVVTWGFSARYAAYIELGTVFKAARPFVRPAMDAEYPRLAMRIRAHYVALTKAGSFVP